MAVLCSGGKDSTLALWMAMREKHEIACLLAMVPKREDSWMFHHPNVKLVDLLAKCVGLPLLKVETSGEKDKELVDLERAMSSINVEGVVSGAIASGYQKKSIDRICEKLGLKHLAPLWGENPENLLIDILKHKFKVIITAVAADGLGPEWLGRELDNAAVEELIELSKKYRINPAGEGGEYESLVLDAPFFKSKIKVVEAENVWRGTSGYYLVKRAEIEGK